jgi:hypothetical protein
MDYTAVGQTTPIAARKEQLAPESILLSAGSLRLAEGYVQVKFLRPVGRTSGRASGQRALFAGRRSDPPHAAHQVGVPVSSSSPGDLGPLDDGRFSSFFSRFRD